MLNNLISASPFYLVRPGYLYRRLTRGRGSDTPVRIPLQTILTQYDLKLLEPARNLAATGRSHSLLLSTQEGKKLLKRYKPNVDAAAITHEHSILCHLAQMAFPAPRLWPTRDGATFVQQGTDRYAIFDWLDGTFQYHHYLWLPRQTHHFITAAGMALGHLHQVLADFTPAGRNLNGFQSSTGERWRSVSWCLNQLQACRTLSLSERPLLAQHLNQYGAWVEDRLHQVSDALKTAPLSRLIIHGDYGPYNLLFHQHKPTTIIDFELARLDWRLSDLAKALPMIARGRMGFSLSKAASFLSSYWQTNPNHASEMNHLHTVWEFLLLRRVIACWGQYAENGARHWLTEAEAKLSDVHWLLQSSQAKALLKMVDRTQGNFRNS